MRECLGLISCNVCLSPPRADIKTRLDVQTKHHEVKLGGIQWKPGGPFDAGLIPVKEEKRKGSRHMYQLESQPEIDGSFKFGNWKKV